MSLAPPQPVPLAEHVLAYLDELAHVRRLSTETVRAYRANIVEFLLAAESRRKRPLAVEDLDLWA
ncbi:MAG TPA: hypothetical protein PKI49_11270, partial [Pseudomonadota bacterium]|nr:hypothetical protein [Pseudomonadota bacterium]